MSTTTATRHASGDGNDPLPGQPRMLSIDELALALCLNKFTVYKWLKDAPERLPRPIRLGRRVVFWGDEVRRWAEHSIAAQRAVLARAQSPQPSSPPPPPRRRGRPTKAEQVARRRTAETTPQK